MSGVSTFNYTIRGVVCRAKRAAEESRAARDRPVGRGPQGPAGDAGRPAWIYFGARTC